MLNSFAAIEPIILFKILQYYQLNIAANEIYARKEVQHLVKLFQRLMKRDKKTKFTPFSLAEAIV